MTYAQWSTGFRGGGVNPRPFIADEAVPFGTETVHAHRVRREDRLPRSPFPRERGRLLQPVREHPVRQHGSRWSSTAVSNQNSTPVNVGAAHIKGAEVEFEAAAVRRPADRRLGQLPEVQLHADQSECRCRSSRCVAQHEGAVRSGPPVQRRHAVRAAAGHRRQRHAATRCELPVELLYRHPQQPAGTWLVAARWPTPASPGGPCRRTGKQPWLSPT